MTGRVTVKSEPSTTVVQVDDGVYIQGDVFGIAKRIMETWPELTIQYLEPSPFNDVTQAPYRIVELCPDGSTHVVTSCWQLTEKTMEEIHAADMYRFANKQELGFKMELDNIAAKERIKKAEAEKNDALTEMVADVLKSPKDTYTAVNPVDGRHHKFTARKMTGQKNV